MKYINHELEKVDTGKKWHALTRKSVLFHFGKKVFSYFFKKSKSHLTVLVIFIFFKGLSS